MVRKRAWWAGVAAVAAAGVTLAYKRRRQLVARALGLAPPVYNVQVKRNLRIPVNDGLTLATDHYAPAAEGSFPTVLIRTPYGRRLSLPVYAQRFAERGYHVVVQDVRGRFGSDGDFEPFLNEAADGEATVAWLARQPWFNGQLGMWGQSYLGYAQWAAATARPEAFDALFPIVASSRGTATAQGEGGFQLELALRWMIVLDALNSFAGRGRSWAPWRGFWRMLPSGQDQVVERVKGHLPLVETDRLATGVENDHYRRSLAPEPPADWAKTDRRDLLARVEAAVHLVGGWYDFMLADLLGDYATLREAGQDPYLTIGPWHHLQGELRGTNLRLGLEWFDTHLKGEDRGLRARPVRVYVMGADEWRDLEGWPPTARQTRYYLHGNQGLAIEAPAATIRPDRYRYDPADPTPAIGGARFGADAGPQDNRALEARPDVLTYTTPSLTEAVEVIGPVRAELFVQSTLRHADFFARLCDVDPAGRSINLCDGIFQIEPGKGEEQPDGTLRLEVDMWATAHRFRRGHRIRLQISSGAHPRYLRNLGTDAPPTTAMEMRPAIQTIYHDPDHPSALVLPAMD